MWEHTLNIFLHYRPPNRNISTPPNLTFSQKCEQFSHPGFLVLNGPLTSLKHPLGFFIIYINKYLSFIYISIYIFIYIYIYIYIYVYVLNLGLNMNELAHSLLKALRQALRKVLWKSLRKGLRLAGDHQSQRAPRQLWQRRWCDMRDG